MRHGRPLLPNSWGLLSSSVGYPDCNNQLHSQDMGPKAWVCLGQNLAHSRCSANICSMARAEWVASLTGMEPKRRPVGQTSGGCKTTGEH